MNTIINDGYYFEDQTKNLRCVYCQAKELDLFSEYQQAKVNPYTNIPLSNRNKAKPITCTKRPSSQRSELKCYKCAQTKTLDEFSKIQRKLNEYARCISCIKKAKNNVSSSSSSSSNDD